MSIKATCFIDRGLWQISVPEVWANDLLAVGFKQSSGETVVFDGLRFGYSFMVNGEVTSEGELPRAGVVYRSTDQDVLEFFEVEAQSGDSVSLSVWCENGGSRSQEEFSFIVPRTEQPFPSWVWDFEENNWVAPKPYPADPSEYYGWSEEALEWQPLSVIGRNG